MERFARLAAQAMRQVLDAPLNETFSETDLESPPDRTLGDFGFPCFKLAKQYRKSPPQLAEQLTQQILDKKILHTDLTVRAVGPYVNFTVRPERVTETLLQDILAGKGNGNYGSLPAKSRGNWVLEFSSPNVAKPLNIYHLRTTVLGAVLDRIGRFRGFGVTTINHLGDWGKQYGFLSVAFRRYKIDLQKDVTMRELVDMYVKINADAAQDPTIEEEAKSDFVKLENGDPEVKKVWQKCLDISLKDFERMYRRINVRFDHVWSESFYTPYIPAMLKDMRDKKLLIESEGAWVVPVEDEAGRELPPCILEKSDGASIYATRDVTAALYRQEKLDFDRMTYIVGQEQKLHFQQIFAVLKKAGFSWWKNCEHVPTGLYRFKDAKMSTRKGNFITLEEVLDFAKERVSQLMRERFNASAAEAVARPDIVRVEPTDEICEKIAVAAVLFHDLSTDPARDVEFDVNRVVDFEGETGPYLQYAHTRCLSILRKAQAKSSEPLELIATADLTRKLEHPIELDLLKILGQFPLHLERTLKFSKASQLCHYLIDVTKAFGLFYRECRVLGDDPKLTHARLLLVEATRRILGQGLELLGLPIPEKM